MKGIFFFQLHVKLGFRLKIRVSRQDDSFKEWGFKAAFGFPISRQGWSFKSGVPFETRIWVSSQIGILK